MCVFLSVDRSLQWLNRDRVLFIGADVTHPSGKKILDDGRCTHPSLASVTGNVDRHFQEYFGTSRLLRSKQEVMEVDQIKPMIKEVILNFAEGVGDLPQKIIFCRDGVSLGQHKDTIKNEVSAVFEAFEEILEEYNETRKRPQLMFLVVKKGHKTNMFVKNPRDLMVSWKP